MFKRSGILLLILLYMATVSGFAMNLHYCGNNLASLKFNAPAKSCGMELAALKMKCCKDKHIEVKVKDAHQSASQSILSKIFIFDLPKLPFEDFMLSAQKALLEKFFDRGPPDPPSGSILLFLKNCIFRI